MGVINMADEKPIGKVFAFFAKPSVAAIEIIDGELKKGDKIKIKGTTTDFEQILESIQIEHTPVDSLKKGDKAGIKVNGRVRPGDLIYKAL